ncbi:MAG: hybrid sensor histidine kinase/response regulator [Chloroflexi bacterium]|nr:hybrid sensor histidine kinase/response regulator [Chloroflexota bacterium]MBP8054736.1 hybrid sensor histidine kinase/response regulator [Chloroflexota bacterium]
MSLTQSIRVLIAEDDFLVGEMVNGLLTEMGYQVVGETNNGAEAITLTQTLHPDVVVMDIEMPRMNGLDAAGHIYEECPTPVVILTAYETPELVQRAGSAGVGAYLVKPPNARDLERAITIARARFADILQLRGLNGALQEQNEELNAFSHTVAHNIQSSISRIIGFSELLQHEFGTLSPDEREQCLQAIVRNARKVSNIVDELLILASVRSTEVENQPLMMGEIVEEAQYRLVDMIQETQAQIRLPAGWPIASGYGPWVEEVWENYLSNALKYGGTPPVLELGATEMPDGGIRFWVQDQGPGLSPEQQAQLFTPFTKLDQVRLTGHGLGLSIVRRIMDKLGGHVGVESGSGGGSRFWFWLPKISV